MRKERKPLLNAGTIVGATIIGEPSSTRGATRTRDPEVRRMNRGDWWSFGVETHVKTVRRCVTHATTTTDAAPVDLTRLPPLLHGQETTLYGEKAYYQAEEAR